MSKSVEFGHREQGVKRSLTVMAYGPYDNAFLLLGFTDGVIVGIDPATLVTRFMHKISSYPVTSIVIDPLNSFMVGC